MRIFRDSFSVTAEIAILNRSAVALAADSAVTIGTERGPKIFNTVNKLFTLSKCHPVGAMVYGNAQLMSVPWETIVKTYRAKLRDKSFAHLEDYASDFLRYLAGNRALFPAAEQTQYFQRLVSAFYRCINDEIQAEAKKRIGKSGSIPISDIRRIAQSRVANHFNQLKACKTLRGFTREFETRLLRKYSSVLRKLRAEYFQKVPLSSGDLARIRTMSGWLFTKDNFRLQGASGFVVAGFGEKDIYPRLSEFTVEGVIQNKLRFCQRRHTQVGVDCISTVVPFAQTEVVRGFVEGIDPEVERLLDKFLDEIFVNYPPVLLNSVKGLTHAAKTAAVKKTRAVGDKILKTFRQEFQEFRHKTLVNPLVSTVAVLPKDELAAMAEALVNLTSFKRRFSPNAETVGGPVDVAVISKGDGFIWVKHKHYFKPELNPHFSTNYFREMLR